MTADWNLAGLIADVAATKGDAVLFEMLDGRTVSYRQFMVQVGQIAGALIEAGVQPGDRVTAQVEKSIEAVALFVATLGVGAVFNPLNSGYTSSEAGALIADAEPRVLVASAAMIAEHAGFLHKFSLEADGTGSLMDAAAHARPFAAPIPRRPDDLAALLYTSGTTGRSKGAMLTHQNLVSNARSLNQIWRVTAADRLLHALPIYHVHGLFVALNTILLAGGSMLWLPKFEPKAVLAMLPKATMMMGVPTFYTRLLGEPGLTQGATSHIRLFVSGSAPLLAETHRTFRERTGHAILERYGMTETGMITSNPFDGERIAGTVGYPLPDVLVRVTDDAGRSLPAGEIGTIEVRGPNVFSGYWRMPEKTAAEFRPGGFFITGDQGQLAEDGRLTLVGRAKDMIISGGLNIYPIEIEQELDALPDVGESAVIGVPHPDFGEAVVAVIVAIPGAEPPAPEAVLKDLGQRLARFKLPKRVIAVKELPRNAMGKVQKTELRRMLARIFEL